MSMASTDGPSRLDSIKADLQPGANNMHFKHYVVPFLETIAGFVAVALILILIVKGAVRYLAGC